MATITFHDSEDIWHPINLDPADYDIGDLYDVDSDFEFAYETELELTSDNVDNIDGAKLVRIPDSNSFDIKSAENVTIGRLHIYMDYF